MTKPADQQPASTGAIRIVVADDHDLVRAGIVAIITAEPGMIVVAEAGNGAAAATAALEHSADVVLMDVSMPESDGLEGLNRIVSADADCAVIMLTTFSVRESVERALRSGAAGYLLKTASTDEMLRAIYAAHHGDRVFSRAIQDQLVSSFLGNERAEPARPEEIGLLTEREYDVFIEIARGHSNAEIANALFLSEATVKTYVTRLLAKLHLRDRVQAVIYALQHGLVPDEE